MEQPLDATVWYIKYSTAGPVAVFAVTLPAALLTLIPASDHTLLECVALYRACLSC